MLMCLPTCLPIYVDTRCVHVTYTCVHVRARYVYTDTYIYTYT